VRDETPPGQLESARGYLSRRELSLHVDLAQIVGLMCVRQARQGGYSQYASGLAVHNQILATRPDLMTVLYRGFPYHRRGEALLIRTHQTRVPRHVGGEDRGETANGSHIWVGGLLA
jgi:Taurine catabolism dioxygenase TauD, TfdA family